MNALIDSCQYGAGAVPTPWSAAPAAAPETPEHTQDQDTQAPQTVSNDQDRFQRGPSVRRPRWMMDPRDAQGARRNRRTDRDGDLKLDKLKRKDFERPASQISQKDMSRVFGSDGARLHELAKAHSDITIGGLLELQRTDGTQISQVTELLGQRKDLGFNDLVDRDGGVALLKQATWDGKSEDAVRRSKARPDDLLNLGNQFQQSFGARSHEAYSKATDLLSERNDLSARGITEEAQGYGSLDGEAAYWRFMNHHGDLRTPQSAFDLIG